MEEEKEKSSYLELKEDWECLTGRNYDSTGIRAVAGLKIFGKSLFNVGKFALTEVLPGMAKISKERVDDMRRDAEKIKNK